MKTPYSFISRRLFASLLVCGLAQAADTGAPNVRWEKHVELVLRLRKADVEENAFGADYWPIYHAALPWYGLWVGSEHNPVDSDMVAPEDYAADLASALEAGRNYFAEKPGASFPLVFQKTLPDRRQFHANYLLSLPEGFPKAGHVFPLVIDLHGSGWIGHEISLRPGSGPAGPTFNVTPINMSGPWNIDFLNAYLDELLANLPVDKDRVYLQGSQPPGRQQPGSGCWPIPSGFAAISPRAGIGGRIAPRA